jgi:hypothetical protein
MPTYAKSFPQNIMTSLMCSLKSSSCHDVHFGAQDTILNFTYKRGAKRVRHTEGMATRDGGNRSDPLVYHPLPHGHPCFLHTKERWNKLVSH